MTWKLRNPTHFVLGFAAFVAGIAVGISIITFLGWDGLALVGVFSTTMWTPQSVWIPLTFIVGAILFFSGLALIGNSFRGREAPS